MNSNDIKLINKYIQREKENKDVGVI